MDKFKLRMKIGSNEFEAEGPIDEVKAQLETFRKEVKAQLEALQNLGSLQPSQKEIKVPLQETIDDTIPLRRGGGSLAPKKQEHLNALFTGDSKENIVTLKIPTAKGKRQIADAVLLILLGYQLIRNEDHIKASKIKRSLSISGITNQRFDQRIDKDIKEGLIIVAGQKKGTNYRLTNTGIANAEELMNGILKQII